MTDWYTDELFTHPHSEIVKFGYSRLVCDVERLLIDEPMEQYGHGIAYTNDSYGNPLRIVDRDEIIEKYYSPHHSKLTRTSNQLLSLFNTVVIVDCHSFSDEVLPHEQDTGKRPDFCLGIDEFHTPPELVDSLKEYLTSLNFSVAIDDPFSGTIVPLINYQKTENLKSIMIEINRKLYLNGIEKNDNFDYIQQVVSGLLDKIVEYEDLHESQTLNLDFI